MPPGLGLTFNLKSKVIFPEIAMSSCFEIKWTEFIALVGFFLSANCSSKCSFHKVMSGCWMGGVGSYRHGSFPSSKLSHCLSAYVLFQVEPYFRFRFSIFKYFVFLFPAGQFGENQISFHYISEHMLHNLCPLSFPRCLSLSKPWLHTHLIQVRRRKVLFMESKLVKKEKKTCI